jgi:hypothetical protein
MRYLNSGQKKCFFFDTWVFGSYGDYFVLSHLGGRHNGGGGGKS